MIPRRAVDELAAGLADGIPVDWAAAEATAGDESERELIGWLRRIGEVADYHRAASPAAPGVPPRSWGHLRILDKIGELIRERFKIWGQVQALTGEGRLSGIVLLALPPALFLAVYRLNPDYVMVLFTDPMGKQMLAGGVILQVLGALVIRKIVNIKV